MPEVTRREIAAAAGVPAHELTGAYAGLNHRGFWYYCHDRRGPVLERVLQRLADGSADLPGADADAVRQLHAFPDKYHRLLRAGVVIPPGRAAALDRLRSEILAEAVARPDTLPASLAGRDMPWHRVIVLPVLRALAGGEETVVVTRADQSGVAREAVVRLHGDAIEEIEEPSPPRPMAAWLARFALHEAAVLLAAERPSRARVEAALELDPLVPPRSAARAADAVWASYLRWSAEDTQGSVRRQDARV